MPPRLELNLPQYKRTEYVASPDLVQRVQAAAYRTPQVTTPTQNPSIGTYDYNSFGQVQPDTIQQAPELNPIDRYNNSLQALKERPTAGESIGQSYQNQLETTLQGGRNATQTVLQIVEQKRREAERIRQQKLLQAMMSSRSATGSIRPGSLGSTGGVIFGGKAGQELDTIGKRAVALASTAIGTWYKFGGTSLTRGVDCSGLIWTVYRSLGINLPRVSRDQARAGKIISGGLRNARPGDIIVMNSPALGRNRHVALYAGGGYMIEAPHTGARVRRVRVPNYNFVVRPY
jgi:cell wall-associated NlpC family hydrolase